MENDWNNRTLWCGSLDSQATEILLRELFVQGGPVEEVRISKDSGGRPTSYAFVTFVHAESVAYSLALFEGTCLFGRRLKLRRRPDTAVDDTYVNIMNRYNHERARNSRRSQCGQSDQHHNKYYHQNLHPYQHPHQSQNERQHLYQNQYRLHIQHLQYNQYPQHSQHQQYYNPYTAVQANERQRPEPWMHLAVPPALPLSSQQPLHTYVPTPIHTYVPTPIRDLSGDPKLTGYSGQQVPEFSTGQLNKEKSENN